MLLFFASWITLAFLPPVAPQPAAPSPYDVIAAVNALRANYGLEPLATNTYLMIAAQNQTDYLASLGGPNITNGHMGAGGTYAIDRAIAAGYPVAQGVDVIECWAWTRGGIALNTIITDPNFWGDQIHMDVMLHAYGHDVGAGVTEKDGNVYYILDVGTIWGVSSGTASTLSTTPYAATTKKSTTPQVAPVNVSTPDADGSIKHVVEAGQALWSIAIAYGTTVEQLQQLNNLQANAVIYEGETLLIRLGNTPIPTPTATLTPRPPTRTPIPPQLAETIEPDSSKLALPSLGGLDRTTLGLILILICGIGLVLISMSALRKGK